MRINKFISIIALGGLIAMTPASGDAFFKSIFTGLKKLGPVVQKAQQTAQKVQKVVDDNPAIKQLADKLLGDTSKELGEISKGLSMVENETAGGSNGSSAWAPVSETFVFASSNGSRPKVIFVNDHDGFDFSEETNAELELIDRGKGEIVADLSALIAELQDSHPELAAEAQAELDELNALDLHGEFELRDSAYQAH